jgi:predicted type IV restriction endonuclease
MGAGGTIRFLSREYTQADLHQGATTMKDALLAYVKRVKELAEHVKGNEQATKQSLIGPLFTLLGYDLTDPRECVPEYKADFGKERSAKPVDWAFYQNSRPIFFVEAKDAGRKLSGYDEQLGDYFAKEPEVKLGILTNGVMWRFFTDIINANVMDREPFVKWDVLNDEEPPYDFLTLLQKSQFKAELVRTFARRQHEHNLLVKELAHLLEPSPEFTKLAIANIETRKLTETVVENWKPIVASAIEEWAKQRTLSLVLNTSHSKDETHPPVEPPPPPVKPPRYEVRRRYWEGLLARAKEKTPLHAHIAPGEFNWLGVRCGPGLNLNYVIKKEAGQVELYIDRGAGTAAVNKATFDQLQKRKEEIEREFGGKLSWERLDEKQGCRIAHVTTLGGYKSDESNWPEIQDAMIDAMIRLEKALAAPLEKLKAELAAEGA